MATSDHTQNPSLSAQSIWQGFHWTFFIDVQGLILSLLRFEKAYSEEDFVSAELELRCAAALLLASGAAMQLSGKFSPQEYNDEVRLSMMPPKVRSANFSGLMSWEHARLIKLWQKLGPTFGNLPEPLQAAHGEFVAAFVNMIGSHRNVCSKFVGEDPSLRSSDSAVNVLEKVLTHRLRIIDPKQLHASGCPFMASRIDKKREANDDNS